MVNRDGPTWTRGRRNLSCVRRDAYYFSRLSALGGGPRTCRREKAVHIHGFVFRGTRFLTDVTRPCCVATLDYDEMHARVSRTSTTLITEYRHERCDSAGFGGVRAFACLGDAEGQPWIHSR